MKSVAQQIVSCLPLSPASGLTTEVQTHSQQKMGKPQVLRAAAQWCQWASVCWADLPANPQPRAVCCTDQECSCFSHPCTVLASSSCCPHIHLQGREVTIEYGGTVKLQHPHTSLQPLIFYIQKYKQSLKPQIIPIFSINCSPLFMGQNRRI